MRLATATTKDRGRRLVGTVAARRADADDPGRRATAPGAPAERTNRPMAITETQNAAQLPDDLGLAGRVALVTGGTGGDGAGVCRRPAGAGARGGGRLGPRPRR